MEKLYQLLVLLTLSAQSLLSQNVFHGKVLDIQTQEQIVGAAVIVPGTTQGVLTDASGGFTITPIKLTDSIEVRYLGYVNTKFKLHSDKINILAVSSSAKNMEEIVVTANRENQQRAEIPMAISKISTSLINDTKPTLLTEVLNKVPGVSMLNLNNEQHGMGIRQPMGTSNYFLYMEDGIPMRPMGVFNHNALIEMNLFAISSIEVVKGPASSLYGPEAVGGAINFITQKPTAVLTAKAGLQSDNLGYRRFQYGSGGMISKRLGYYAGGYYAQQNNGWMTNSDYEKNSVNLRMDYDVTERTKLIFAGAYNHYYSETGGGIDSTAFYSRQYESTTDFTYRKVNSLRFRASLEQKWNENNFTMIHVFLRDNVIEQNPAYAIRWTTGKTTASGQVNSNYLNSRGFIAQHSVRFAPLQTKIITGVSLDNSPNTYNAYQVDLKADLRNNGMSVNKYTINEMRPDLVLSNYSADILNYAAYTQMEFKPLHKMSVNLGGRFDVMSFNYFNYLDQSAGQKVFKQFSPKLGATYKVTSNVGVYVNYAKGFSPPGLTTVFTKKAGTNPSEFYYNLESAGFANYEIGAWTSLLRNKIDLEVSIYQLNGRNELLNVRQEDNSTDYQSAGKTEHKGIEYNFFVRPNELLSFRVSGTYAIHRYNEFILSSNSIDQIKDVNGKIMPSAPRNVMNSEIIYKPRFVKGMRLGIEWQYMESWFMDQVNSTKYEDKGAFGVKGISVLNVRAGYRWKAFEVFANVMNITNELYAFNVTRGNSMRSKAIYTPAPPRSFVIGFQYNFTAKQ